MPALFFDLFGNGAGQIVGGGASDGFVLEAADTGELGFGDEVEQDLEVALRFTGEADDERRAQRQIGHVAPPPLQAGERFFLVRGAAHGLEHGG